MTTVHLARGRSWTFDGPRVVGILNATPDSFSDGGDLDGDALHARIVGLLDEGAHGLDVGGESTRPGHAPVGVEEELRRTRRVLDAVRDVDRSVPVSIDTSKPAVARAALEAGADWVNDVTALDGPGIAPVVREAGCSVVLMRHADLEGDMVSACAEELARLVGRALAAGIHRDRLVVDPGLGFGARPGPSVEDNLALVDGMAAWNQGLPVLVGASRKRFVGAMMGEPDPKRRVAGSVEVALRAARQGAALLRVHDVGATVDALARA